MHLIRITAYPWLPPQTAIRRTMEEAIALQDDLVAMGYSVEIIEVKNARDTGKSSRYHIRMHRTPG